MTAPTQPTLTPEPMPAPVASTGNLTRNSRAERARMPVALHVAEDVAIQHGVCIRPITQRVTDTYTGEVTLVDVPCGATLESKCPPCAVRAKRLRMHQCRIQPKNARPGMTPGACKAKAHQREHLGYGGRRVLVSRRWSGKTLTDHRHERRAFVLALRHRPHHRNRDRRRQDR